MQMTLSLVHMLHRSVKRYPNSEALVYKAHRISYKNLWDSIIAIASFLKNDGLNQGDRVAIFVENSPEYVEAYYGILIAGGVAVGLNTAAKARDINNLIRHCDAKYLIAHSTLAETGKIIQNLEKEINVILIGELAHYDIKNRLNAWDSVIRSNITSIDLKELDNANKLAAIIYTSGTTGSPKGVMLSHGNLANNMESILDYLKLQHTDSILNVLPFYYTYGNSVLHTHLAVGATCIIENNTAFPHKLLSLMVKEKVTGFSGVPSTFALLMSRIKLSEYDLSNVRYMTQAGGAMPPANILRLKNELPHIKFFVMYGQTEATARLTYLPPEKLDEKLGSIGIPIKGVNIEIRDENGNKVQENTTGEICVNGENVMMGYWNDVELTNKAIIDGWLKTGDLAHYDSDGYIYIDGRSSEMIKTGAHRISPKEIEEVVAELEEIEEVAAYGVEDEIMGQVIKLAVVLRPDSSITMKEILLHCKSNLATYKIPKYIEFMSSIPKTASGKIKRFQLQESNS